MVEPPSSLGVGGVLAGGMGVLDDISRGNVSFGTVLNAANVLKNGGALTSPEFGGEPRVRAVDAIGQTTGIDVSGVAGVAFPKGGGGGGASTIAVPRRLW